MGRLSPGPLGLLCLDVYGRRGFEPEAGEDILWCCAYGLSDSVD